MTITSPQPTIFAISGSLRRGSLNSRLIDEARKLATDTLHFDVYDRLADLPRFNEDCENPAPALVQDLRDRVRAADGVLIATPEYNASIPGTLKDAIDWLSRPVDGHTLLLTGKPVAIIGASIGPLGTVRAQLALRQILHKVDASVVRQPEFMLPGAHLHLDDTGLEADSVTLGVLGTVLDQLQQLVRVVPAT